MPRYESVYPAVQIGLAVDRAELDARIADRTGAMFAAGLVDEVRRLERAGLREGRTASRALGYAQVLRFLAGEYGEAEAPRADRPGDQAVRPAAGVVVPPRPPGHLAAAGAADAGDLLERSLATIGPCGSRRGTAPRTTS